MRFSLAVLVAFLLLGGVTLFFADLYSKRDHGLDLPAVEDNVAERLEREEGTRVARESSLARPSMDVASGRLLPSQLASMPPNPAQNTEQYENTDPNPVKLAVKEPLSTFSADVDTTSYSVMRRYVQQSNELPPSEAVRIEEMVNYFEYEYPSAESAEKPFKPITWVTPSPWRNGSKLLHIGVKGYEINSDNAPDVNIVFLLDVSGSMASEDKLPLVKKSVNLMLDELGPGDTVAIVVYAGAAGVVLEPTSGSEKTKIRAALDRLAAGGSTAGGAGLSLAYSLAQENYSSDKVNRIILASDGDFNVGVVDADSLEDYVARKRKTGIYLTVLGYGSGNYNDVIAQRLAQAGNGVAAYIDNLNEARKVLVREFRSTVFPIARDLKFQVEFNPAVVESYRLIGYETRLLNDEDFNNDAIDAGDIGSGHTVTALYEMTLVGSDVRLIDESRYQKPLPVSGPKDEFAYIKLRYKLLDADESDLISLPVRVADAYETLAEAPNDARFAASVAAFGQKLNGSGHTKNMSYIEIAELARSGKGNDEYGDRMEFINIVRMVSDIDNKNLAQIDRR